MSLCDSTHPSCLKIIGATSAKFCAGCGRPGADIAAELAESGEGVTEQEDGVSDADVTTHLLDLVSESDSTGDDDVDDVAVIHQEAIDEEPTAGTVPSDAEADLTTTLDLGEEDSGDAPGGSTPYVPPVALADAMIALQGWATKWEVLGDPYVSGVMNAVSRRDDLTMWASLNPLEYLPTPTAKRQARILDRVVQILGALRNILVFVPVALTWFAISRATEAYGAFRTDFPDLNLNFLQFWQSGAYGEKIYLDDFWRIGDVARFDALLIALIVVSTMAIGIMGERLTALTNSFDTSTGVERMGVGFLLAQALHGRRQASPESIGESLAEALNDLTQAARDVNDVAARLERASAGVESLTPKIETLNSHTEKLVSQTAASISGAVNGLVSSVSSLNSAVSTSVTQVFTDATANLEEVSQQFARISASVELGTAQLRADLDEVHQQLAKITRGGRP